MAEVAQMEPSPAFVQRLCDSLRESLRLAGIEVEILTEPIPLTRMHRITLISNQFEHLRPSERQALVWRIAEEELTPEEQMQISLLLTLSPGDLDEDYSAR